MTFDAIQTGPLGRKVELYEFSQSGVFTRVTSAATTQFIGAAEFIPLAGLTRSNPTQGNEISSGDLSVKTPASFSIAQQFRTIVPSTLPALTIFKKHLNDPDDVVETFWKGTITSCAFGDQDAVLRGRPITRLFDRPIPRAVFSPVCNHMLYDQGCTVTRADYTDNSLVLTSEDSAGTTFIIAGLRNVAAAITSTLSLNITAQEIDDFWQRGILATLASPAEFRMIVETDIGGNPDSIRVNIPFSDLSPGDGIQLQAGCPHSLNFCDRKFNNAPFFGGYPFIPLNNPFQIDLDGGVATPEIRPPAFFRSR